MEYNGYYVGAPYNFIEMNHKVYGKKEIQPHDKLDTSRHSGVIDYELEAITPIMVDDGKGHFYRNIYNKLAVPGSTMRGLVRNNMQILSFSSFADDIQDGRLMYRNVANGRDKERYNDVLGNKPIPYTTSDGKRRQMSVLRNVKAGYIRNEGGSYRILPTVLDSKITKAGQMNYYVVSERKIIEGMDENFNFLLYHKPYIMQNNLKPFKSRTVNGFKHYKGEKNNSYTPYAIEVSYELSGVRNVTGIAAKGKLSHNGYLVSTGEIPEKKVIYVIPQIDEKGEAIDIPQEDIDNFKRDYEGRKTQVSEAFALPQNGKTKPVFYIKLEGDKKLYFGYTPRLRLFYDKTIHDGICKEQKNVAIDYCKSIFGYSNDKESYKSRVSFMDALTLSDSAMPKETKLLLGMPKPTSCLDYLTSDKNEAVSYNDNFKLRGVKQYWLRKGTIKGEPVQNDKIASVLRPCAKGTRFKGSIRFENLSDSELGMLLWSLLLEKNSNQNIGKGKPYGYGRIAVKLSGLKVLDYDKMYGDDILSIDPYIDMTDKAKDYIKAAKDDMTTFLGRDVMTMPRIRDFLLMKDTTKIPDSEDTRYMRISVKVENGKDYNEYQKRDNNVVKLPTVKEVVERKPLQSLKSKKQK